MEYLKNIWSNWSAVAAVLLFLEFTVSAEQSSFVEPLVKTTMNEAPFCSSGISNHPCRIDDVCHRTNNLEVVCFAKVIAHASSEYSLFSYSPPMDLRLSFTEATEDEKLYFVEAFANLEISSSTERSPELIQIDMSLPMPLGVVDLLNDLYFLEASLISTVNSSGVLFALDDDGLLVQPSALWSADWMITLFKAECSDPDSIALIWIALKNKFNLTQLALRKCNLNKDITMEKQLYLQSLQIESCRLHDLPDNFFERIPNIRNLLLSSSSLTELPHSISNLKKLEELYLSGNLLLPSQNLFTILLSLNNLQKLHLSRIRISSILQLEPILNTSSLQLNVLHLSESQLMFIQEEDIELLSKQIKLKHLDLSSNSITYIPTDWSNLQINMKVLNLSSNFLKTVNFRFHPEAEFKVIDISNNKLSFIGDILLSGRTQFLNISHNNITEIVGLNCNNSINYLNLSYNSIENLTENNVLSMSSLQSIDLGGNLFNCQVCNITILQKWINKDPKLKIIAINGTQDLFCAFPNYPRLKVVDVKQEECKEDNLTSNPQWTRVFTISMVLSLICLTVVLLRGYQFETCFLIQLWRNNEDNSSIDSQDYQYDAFVCYSNADREWVVNELMKILEAAPHFYKLCDHERDFILGSFISQNVLQSMQLSRQILFILSESFLNSQWCVWELEMARHREFEEGVNSPILVELLPLDHSALSNTIASLLSGPNILDGPDDPLFWNKLVTLLGPSLACSLSRSGNSNRT